MGEGFIPSPFTPNGVELAYADWSDETYRDFHDEAFDQIFNTKDWGYLSQDELEQAEELFETGWLNFNISEDERESARLEWQNLTNLEFSRQDWELFRELYNEANT